MAACFTVDQLFDFLLVPFEPFVLIGECISISKEFSTQDSSFRRCRVLKVKAFSSSAYLNCIFPINSENSEYLYLNSHNLFETKQVQVKILKILPKSSLYQNHIVLLAQEISPLVRDENTSIITSTSFEKACSVPKTLFYSINTDSCVNYRGCVTDDKWKAMGIYEIDNELLFVAHPFSDAFLRSSSKNNTALENGSFVEIYFAHPLILDAPASKWKILLYGCVCSSLFWADNGEFRSKKTHFILDSFLAQTIEKTSAEGLIGALLCFLKLDSFFGDDDERKTLFFFQLGMKLSDLSSSKTFFPLGQTVEDAISHDHCQLPPVEKIAIAQHANVDNNSHITQILSRFMLIDGVLAGTIEFSDRSNENYVTLRSLDCASSIMLSIEGPVEFLPFVQKSAFLMVSFDFSVFWNEVFMQHVICVYDFIFPWSQKTILNNTSNVVSVSISAASSIFVSHFRNNPFVLLEVASEDSPESNTSKQCVEIRGAALLNWLLYPSFSVSHLSLDGNLVARSGSSLIISDPSSLIDCEISAATLGSRDKIQSLLQVCKKHCFNSSTGSPVPNQSCEKFDRQLVEDAFTAVVLAIFRPKKTSTKITIKLKDISENFMFDLIIDCSFFHIPSNLSLKCRIFCSNLILTTNKIFQIKFFELGQFSKISFNNMFSCKEMSVLSSDASSWIFNSLKSPLNFYANVILTFVTFKKVDFDSNPVFTVDGHERIRKPFFSASLLANDGARQATVYFYDLKVFLAAFPLLTSVFEENNVVRINFEQKSQLLAIGTEVEKQFKRALKEKYYHCCSVQSHFQADERCGTIKLLCVEYNRVSTIEMLNMLV